MATKHDSSPECEQSGDSNPECEQSGDSNPECDSSPECEQPSLVTQALSVVTHLLCVSSLETQPLSVSSLVTQRLSELPSDSARSHSGKLVTWLLTLRR